MVRLHRLFALALVLAGSARASPPPEPPGPPPVLTVCGSARPWARVLSCLTAVARDQAAASHAAVPTVSIETVATAEHVRAVRVSSSYDATPSIYVELERDNGWVMTGLLYNVDAVESVEPVTIAGRPAVRIVRGEQTATAFDSSPRIAWMMTLKEIYCTGGNIYCSEAVTSCDVLVHGAARETFRGRTKLGPGVIEILGDRTLAGRCAPPDRVPLG